MTVAASVSVRSDGGGVVRAGVGLDDEALRQAPDLGQALATGDLAEAGWRVTGPRKEGDGLTWVRAIRSFEDADSGTEALGQLTGPSGPFRDLRLTRRRSGLRTRTSFSGLADLSAGLQGFGDPEFQRLAGQHLGLDLDALRRRFGPGLPSAVRSEVTVRLPGGETRVWRPQPGQQVALRATSEAWNVRTLVLAAVALAAAAAAAALLVRGHRARS